MTYHYEFSVACYDSAAAKAAELIGNDPDDTEDVWLKMTIDMRQVVAIRQPLARDKGTWLHMRNTERFRVSADYKTVKKIFEDTRI